MYQPCNHPEEMNIESSYKLSDELAFASALAGSIALWGFGFDVKDSFT
jgi:hypothetical protein